MRLTHHSPFLRLPLLLIWLAATTSCTPSSGWRPPPDAAHPADPEAPAALEPASSDTLAVTGHGAPDKQASAAAPPAAGSAVIYTCPMHPEIRREQPGKCPICGMKLVPASGHAESQKETQP